MCFGDLCLANLGLGNLGAALYGVRITFGIQGSHESMTEDTDKFNNLILDTVHVLVLLTTKRINYGEFLLVFRFQFDGSWN